MNSVNDFYNDRLVKINWFEHCGKPIDRSISKNNFIAVKGWREAEKGMNFSWDNMKLNVRNDLTLALHEQFREEYREWNKITLEVKKMLGEGVLKDIHYYVMKNKLSPNVYESIEWDLITILMEHAYSSLVKPGFYFQLLEIYEQGHVPCGWKGKWPSGSLKVF
ncbi:hypothetical protein [Paenibacillus riograndensis]|uniref:Uncharacterized protein n=2 Tax=Paenibacillus riograndensis TaxID=483937 RepID=A0A0E4HER1_9BACL|nr:hypothetical protein [Paenibacillus riograndensis]CQR59041.1 hypothetical protein PRIO_6694 [Paenibacillus riograndensis SBR5]